MAEWQFSGGSNRRSGAAAVDEVVTKILLIAGNCARRAVKTFNDMYTSSSSHIVESVIGRMMLWKRTVICLADQFLWSCDLLPGLISVACTAVCVCGEQRLTGASREPEHMERRVSGPRALMPQIERTRETCLQRSSRPLLTRRNHFVTGCD